MICNSVYDSLEAIPEALRGEFEKRTDGKYYLKPDAIPGAAELLNPGLAANRDRALQQKQAAETRATEAESKASRLESELSSVRAPGATVLSQEDAKLWNRFTSLGDIKTVEKIVKTDFPKLQKESEQRAGESAYSKAVEELKPFGVALNFEVLRDLMTHPQHGEGLSIESRPTEVEDGKGGKQTVNFPHVIRRVPVAGKENEFTVEATPLLQYAKDKWPSWATAALTAGATDQNGGQAGQAGGAGTGTGLLPLSTGAQAPAATGGASFALPGQSGGGLRMPVMTGGGAGSGGGASGTLDGQKVAQDFNARRNSGKSSPLTRAQPQQQQAGGGNTGQK